MTNEELREYILSKTDKTEPECWHCKHKWECKNGCIWKGWDCQLCDKFEGFYTREKKEKKLKKLLDKLFRI